ncbi:MAG: serine/threonine-protein kinase [Cellvibrionaceae bacterium]
MDNKSLGEFDNWNLLKEDPRTCVYKATLDNAPVIIKTYRLENPLHRLQFWRKSVKVKDFYRDAGEQLKLSMFLSAGLFPDKRKGYLCYRYINGKDFRMIDWGALPERTALSLMEQAAELLRQLHKKGWVHGDFKFGNLLYCKEQDAVYLLDVEGLGKPFLGGATKGRDVARFLLNGLELSVPKRYLEFFWRSYSREFAEPETRQLKQHTKRWLEKLGQRHQRRYGRAVSLEQLTFL